MCEAGENQNKPHEWWPSTDDEKFIKFYDFVAICLWKREPGFLNLNFIKIDQFCDNLKNVFK